MKRALLLLGPLLALAGSIGLLLHGSAIIEILLVLTYRSGTPTASLESLLQNVQLVVLFVYMMMVGLTLAIVALPFPGQPRYTTVLGKLLGCLAGLGLMGAAYHNGKIIMSIEHVLNMIATSTTAPKQAELEQAVAQHSSDLETGLIAYIAGCAVLLLVGIIGFRKGEATRLSSGTKIVISLLMLTVVAIGIVGASGLVWYNVDQVMYVVTDIDTPAEPAAIVSPLITAFQAGVVLYGGIGGLGFVCLFTYLLTPRYKKPIEKLPEA